MEGGTEITRAGPLPPASPSVCPSVRIGGGGSGSRGGGDGGGAARRGIRRCGEGGGGGGGGDGDGGGEERLKRRPSGRARGSSARSCPHSTQGPAHTLPPLPSSLLSLTFFPHLPPNLTCRFLASSSPGPLSSSGRRAKGIVGLRRRSGEEALDLRRRRRLVLRTVEGARGVL